MIDIRDQGRVRYLTLNRPERMNALNSTVLDQLAQAVEGGARDQMRCLVIRGAGERAFCAGADLDEIQGLDSSEAHAFIRRGHRTMNAIENSVVPVVASVDGYALGGGFELMLSCHIVVSSQRSSFGLPEAKIGCMPGFGGTQRLLTTVGKAAAFQILLTGDRFDAHRAWEIGLLSVPPVETSRLVDEVDTVASQIAAASSGGTRSILEAARRAARPAALEHEAALAALAIASPDGQEGIRAFAEGRAPNFTEESER